MVGFSAVDNVAAWWTENFEGSTQQPGDIFTVRFGEVFITSQVTERIPGHKIVWLVLDCNKPWLKNTKEWNGTEMAWEIIEKGDKTLLHLTHVGLTPEAECFDVCSNAWGEYLRQSLWPLITTGTGCPGKKAARPSAETADI